MTFGPKEFNVLHTARGEQQHVDALLWAMFFVGGLMGAAWALVQVYGKRARDEPEHEMFGVSR